MKRRFAKVERFVWDDARFRALPNDARLMWVYLLTTPLATSCPGLVLASEVAVGEHLGWIDTDDVDTIADGLRRVRTALEVLSAPTAECEHGWISYDRTVRVIFIRKVLRHDPPTTMKQVKSWIRRYREIPACSLKTEWLQAARNAAVSLYGSDDPRSAALSTLVRSIKRQMDDASEPSERAFKMVNETQNAVAATPVNSLTVHHGSIKKSHGSITAPSKNLMSASQGTHETPTESHNSLNQPEPCVTTEELDSVNNQNTDQSAASGPKTPKVASFDNSSSSKVLLRSGKPELSNTEEGGTRKSAAANEDDLNVELDFSGASGPEGRTPHPVNGSSSTSKKKAKRKNKKYETEGKPEQPPSGFNARQKAVWEALRTATFYVPGQGLMTAWQAVSDPVLLAAQLGGDAYPAVDVGLVHRLGNWTTQHKQRAKREVGRFLLNRFSTSQERGSAPQSAANSKTQGAPRAGNQPDLEERVARLSENRKGIQCNE